MFSISYQRYATIQVRSPTAKSQRGQHLSILLSRYLKTLFFSSKVGSFTSPYPFFPPFLRDSAGVLGGEGERLLFLLAELALRSLRSGVREDWSDKIPCSAGSEGWRMRIRAAEWEDGTDAHTRKGSFGRLTAGREGGREGGCRGGGGDDQGSWNLSTGSFIQPLCIQVSRWTNSHLQ